MVGGNKGCVLKARVNIKYSIRNVNGFHLYTNKGSRRCNVRNRNLPKSHYLITKTQKITHIQLLRNYPLGITTIVQLLCNYPLKNAMY